MMVDSQIAQTPVQAGELEVETLERAVPRENRITVRVRMPHLAEFGHETTRELVYGCNFAVAVGDTVDCPGSYFHPARFLGVVSRLDGDGYSGPVKFVRKTGDLS